MQAKLTFLGEIAVPCSKTTANHAASAIFCKFAAQQGTMDKKRERYTVNVILMLLTVVLFSAVLFRALRLSISQEEAHLYLHYLKGSWREVFLVGDTMLPNGQLLNLFLSKLSLQLFGFSVFSLRLPNVIFSLVFFWNAAWLAKSIRFPLAQVAVFLIFSLPAIYFDFFAMSSGYGMGLALLMAAIHHFYMYRKLQNGHHLYRSLIFSAFAAYASFTLLLPYLALLVLLNLNAWGDGIRKVKAWWIINRANLVVSAVLALAIYYPLRAVPFSKQPALADFFDELTAALSQQLIGTSEIDYLALAWSGLLGLALIAAVIMLARDLFILPTEKHYFFHDALLWLALCLMIHFGFQQGLGTELISHSIWGGLMYPLFLSTIFIFLLERIQDLKGGPVIKKGGLVVAALLLLVDFGLQLNFRSFLTEPQSESNKAIFQTVKRYRESEQLNKVQLVSQAPYEQAMRFYKNLEKSEWLEIKTLGLEKAPHLYLLKQTNGKLDLLEIDLQEYTLLKRFPSDAALFYRAPDQS